MKSPNQAAYFLLLTSNDSNLAIEEIREIWYNETIDF